MVTTADIIALQIAIQAHKPAFLWGGPGLGKCLGRGTPVLMYDGRILPVEEIREGDLLMGPDSTSREVLSTTQGHGPLYRIVPKKGEPWVCNDVHVLTLVHSVTGEVMDIPLDQYITLSGKKKHHLKLFQPDVVHFPYTGKPLSPLSPSPYFLGVWLGDGDKCLDMTRVSKPDAEIEKACRDEADRFGLRVRVDTSKSCPTYCIVGERNNKPNPLTVALRNLFHECSGIPAAYLYGARHDRMELLAGLVDTDGHLCGGNGPFEVVQRNVDLANDIALLARSLGFRVVQREKLVDGNVYQRLSIIGDLSRVPTRIARKTAKPRKQKKNPLRTGFHVEAIGEGEYFGFTLDGDHRFLLGDCTVTHNTAVTEAIAAALKEPLWTVILSIREPSDQGGLPIVTPDGVRMEPPMWAKQLHKEGHGIVFMDEFNTAPPTTQSSALRVVHGGWAGDLKLPEDTSFVAAGNPPEISTGAYDLTSAIANRWVHFKWPLDPNSWCDGMVSGWPDVPVKKLPDSWKSAISSKRGNVASFIRTRSELLYDLPEDPTEQGRAWPSPRTWDMAAQLLAAAASLGYSEKTEVARKLVAGCVSESAQREFTNWFVKLDLRNPEDYLRDPRNTPLPKRQDQTMATLDSVASSALDRDRKRKEQIHRYQAAWVVMGRVARSRDRGGMGMPDLVIPAARVLAPAMPDELENRIPEEVDDIWPILEAANIDFGPQAA